MNGLASKWISNITSFFHALNERALMNRYRILLVGDDGRPYGSERI